MRLSELLDHAHPALAGLPDVAATEIRGVTADSREVRPGFLFVAIPGRRADGRRFIAEAAEKGAAAVLTLPGLDPVVPGHETVPVLADTNPRQRLAQIAARLHPAQPDFVAAVTGTNGKTSVAAFARQIWTGLGHKAASLGTLGVAAPGVDRPQSLTTPDPVLLHRTLAELAAGGVERLAMEASSHGLVQFRLDGVRVGAGAFTNLSRDHLDFHGSMDMYLEAKLRLFDVVMPRGGTAVLNADSDVFPLVRDLCAARDHRVLTFGRDDADLALREAAPLPDGQDLLVSIAGREQRLHLPLVGGFQAANALCALGLAIASGEDASRALAILPTLEGVPGRMQRVAVLANGAAVYVDYAHTPAALIAVLTALRPHAKGRVIVVFGCGGDRDPGKRPLMGDAARQLADQVIVTDDNPRSEDPAAIRAQILRACPGAVEIGDRAAAIAAGIEALRPGDILVIAGKGHERGQIVGERVLPFDDAEVARAAAGRFEVAR